LYLETCVVDCGGVVDLRRMNDDDVKFAKGWHEVGYIRFACIPSHLLPETETGTHVAVLSPAAHADAGLLREGRARRNYRDFVRKMFPPEDFAEAVTPVARASGTSAMIRRLTEIAKRESGPSVTLISEVASTPGGESRLTEPPRQV
jgi:hypothetical protein